MGEKKIPLYLNEDTLREVFSLTWSRQTLRRRIESGFPAIKDDGGKLMFETQKVVEYFKRREIR